MSARDRFIAEWATPGDSPEGANLEFVRDLDALLAAERERVLSLLLAEGVINELIADQVREGLS